MTLFIVFQAPAAFGLVSFLMHAGLERNRIRKHLLVFALAAPVLAMLTYVGLSQVCSSIKIKQIIGKPWWCQFDKDNICIKFELG